MEIGVESLMRDKRKGLNLYEYGYMEYGYYYKRSTNAAAATALACR